MATLASGKLSEQFEDFLKSVTDRGGNPVYRSKISQLISEEGKSLVVDFGDLLRYNSDLANRVLLEPDTSLASFKIAAFETMRSENALYADRVKRELTVRLRGLPDLVPLRKVDTSHIDRMLAVSGMVVRTSELRPLMTEAAWVCPSGHLTYQEQDDLALKRPPKCELCGEARNFELDRRHSKFIDFQVVRVQELPEELPPGQLPQFFDVNIEGDIVNTARPGDRVVLTGVVRAVPDYALGQLRTRLFRSQIDCNQVEVKGKEPDQVNVTKEDEELIKKIAASPDAYDRLVGSIAPVILGHQAEKEAILLLLAGGSATVLPDGTKLRGDINALFVGDPGCLVADERIALGNGSIAKLGELGSSHLQPLDLQVLTGEGSGERATARRFHRYRSQPILEIVTESGKSIKGTYNHPLLVVENDEGRPVRRWKRLDELRIGDHVAAAAFIPCTVKRYQQTGFKVVQQRLGPRFRGRLPSVVDKDLAGYMGYVLGDGFVDRYSVVARVAEQETDLVPKIETMVRRLFDLAPRFARRLRADRKVAMTDIYLNSQCVASNLSFLREKRVPRLIFVSGNEAVAEFLRWLFEADGTVFSKGWGRRAIGLKAKDTELLRDVQVLLLRWGIHSRIVGDALLIRRGEDIVKYSAHVGFVSKKKTTRLGALVEEAREFGRVHKQLGERVIGIHCRPPEDVYDIEVPDGHRFIANGLISHNTGKSELLKFASQVAPRGLYASGRGTSLDSHEPIIVRRAGTVVVAEIGELVDSYYLPGASGAFVPVTDVDCLSYNTTTGKVEWTPVSFVYRHRVDKPLVRLSLQTGREVTVTDDHSLYAVRKGRLTTVRTGRLRAGDCIAIPGRLPPAPDDGGAKSVFPKELLANRHLARLLGYYVAEGYIHKGKRKGKESYRINFELNREEKGISSAINEACLNLFQKGVSVRNKKKSHGMTVTLSSKGALVLFRDVLGVSQGPPSKRVPTIVFNMSRELQIEFIHAYLEGDRGATSSHYLSSDLQYLIGASLQKVGRFPKGRRNVGRIGNRAFAGGPSYRLKAPNPYKFDRETKSLGPPIEETIPPLQSVLGTAKGGLPRMTANQYRRLTPLVLGRLIHGKGLRRIALLRALREGGEMTTPELARKTGIPRHAMKQLLVSCSRDGLVNMAIREGMYRAVLTELGRSSLEGVEEVRSIMDSDLQFALIRRMKRVKSTSPYVYDLSVGGKENFVAGFGGVLCHNTAAGLSAAVIREKNVLMLEAGVVVLADLGIAAIDEFEKMKPEDRTALHEMMEQQSYHPTTEIMLADGSKTEIGRLVDGIFEKRADLIVKGKDCEVVPLSGEIKLRSLAPGGSDIEAPVDRVSRHAAPDEFIQIQFSNGRTITVTQEHPVFTYSDGRIITVPASELKAGAFVPAPIRIIAAGEEQELSEVSVSPRSKAIVQQTALSPRLGRVLGYLITEGNFHRGRTTEIDFGNFNQDFMEDMRASADALFGFPPITRMTGGLQTRLRYVSKTLLDWFEANFPEMVHGARTKRAPRKILGARKEIVRDFLAAAYLGDGGAEPTALYYRTASKGLAYDYQDLLLRFAIASRIDYDRSNDSFKVYIAGDSLRRFFDTIVERIDPRYDKIKRMVELGVSHERSHDSFPTEITKDLVQIRRRLGLQYKGQYSRHAKMGHGITRRTLSVEVQALWDRLDEIEDGLARNWLDVARLRELLRVSQERLARLAGIKRGAVDYIETDGYDEETKNRLRERVFSAANAELDGIREKLKEIRDLMSYRFLRVTKVESIANRGEWKTRWVYDVTVEPMHSFVSNGVLLHNTVTIAKGGIYATLNARTAILAACNPVLGRYNPFQNLTENIGTLPVPLLTRFDVIFVFRDQPSPAEDERLASHILAVHARRSYTTPPPIEFSLLKKYLTYSKRVSPTLTKGAIDRLREFYLELRRAGGTEDSIPPTPRTLEAMIRIATARARILLRDEVTEEDALAAIALMNRMVEDVLTDATTKKTDFGIQLGKPVGETKNLRTALEVLKNLEGTEKKQVERKLFKEELVKARFSDEDAEKIIRTMFREGVVYESKPGFLRRLGG